jgi:hypothetical protein
LEKKEVGMRVFASVACLFLLVGCASGGAGGGGGEAEGDPDLYVLTAQRLAADPSLTAEQAIRRHRRFWLPATVFLKGETRPVVGPRLQEWMATDILEMRFYRDGDALTKFGPEYRRVIEVTLRR